MAMAEYARVEGSTIIERRDLGDGPPSHKAGLWRLVEYEGDGALSNIVVEAEKVRVIRSSMPLDQLKSKLRKDIEDGAEMHRLKYITGGSAKAMEYLGAKIQADEVLALGKDNANALPNDGADEYPVLSASVPTEAKTLFEAAQLIRSRYEAYAKQAGEIKRKVIEAKAAISDALTEEEARAIASAVVW